MLKNISLRHLIPLMFFSGTLLLLVIYFLLGVPAARDRAIALGQQEMRTLLLSHQGRLINLLVENDPKRLSLELYFVGNDPTIELLAIADKEQNIIYANRSKIVGKSLSEAGIPIGASEQVFPFKTDTNIITEKQPGSDSLFNGFAALKFERGGEEFTLTLIIVRDYSALAAATSKVAAAPSEIIASVMFIISFLAVVLLRQHLKARLTPLLDAANRFSQGEGSARAALKGGDEFAEIGRSFDTMADKLEHYHDDLKAAKRNAEKANLAKNAFLGSLSHEIQTPLSGLLGFLELLRATHLDEEGRLYVRSADSAARTLSALINDLIETSRLEAGQIQTVNEVFCLNSLLQEIVDSILPRAKQKQVAIKIVCQDSDPIWIENDPRIFRQILINLIGNAIQFTEVGEVAVLVVAQPTGGSHIRLNIQVSDTGIGIPAEETDKIFERFYKADYPDAPSAPGPGVGLAICKELADIIGGKISVESTIGKGSIFELDIEVAGADAPGDFDYSVLAQREQKPQHILLVESAEITRTLLRSILSRWRHKILPCKTSQEAIQQMKDRMIYPAKEPITLILLDLQMPGIDGFEVAKEIRGLDTRFARLPIIATSTLSDPNLETKCREAGFDGFIGKPIDVKKMADEIFRLSHMHQTVA